MIRRILIGGLVLVVAICTYPGALVVSLATLATPARDAPAIPPGALPWLHVAHPPGARPYIADEVGRLVLLHGATPAGLLEFGPGSEPLNPIDPAAYADGRCPALNPSSKYPPLCRADLQAMAALGFNSMRLPISWSVLEPRRGEFSQTLVDRIAQIVDWARDLRMYVIIDMHQNAFSHYVAPGDGVNLTYNSGAPSWATITDGFPSRALKSQRELNPAVFQATTNFWYDRDGIQDEYIAALAFVARRFVSDSVVAGYGLYNEPWPGWNVSVGFDDLLLFPFYRRVIDAITGVHDGLPCWSGFFMPAVCGYRDLGVGDRRHLMFLDTGLPREITDFPTHLGMPVSSYPNLVLGLHAYTHIYTPDKLVLGQNPRDATYPWGGYDQSYALAEREAKAMRAALFVEEFGNNSEDDDVVLAAQVLEQEKHTIGFEFWTWKEKGGGAWGVFEPAIPCLRTARERLLARVYPLQTSDLGVRFHYEPSDGSFILRASGRTGDPETVVYLPHEVTGPVSADGAVQINVIDEAGGNRLVLASPTGGDFSIAVSPAPLRLSGCG
ncbi:MAG TPA: cellulase family glycosylhydrolase [Candidatus Dormibacteraeota bacterium]|nr:cellulase family glycosylhydrolase [Candidatus Dormibacteraeota bacterium]